MRLRHPGFCLSDFPATFGMTATGASEEVVFPPREHDVAQRQVEFRPENSQGTKNMTIGFGGT